MENTIQNVIRDNVLMEIEQKGFCDVGSMDYPPKYVDLALQDLRVRGIVSSLAEEKITFINEDYIFIKKGNPENVQVERSGNKSFLVRSLLSHKEEKDLQESLTKMDMIDYLIEGLQILKKHQASIGAQHDIILSGVDRNTPSKEDADRLDELGWHVDPDYGNVWAFFV